MLPTQGPVVLWVRSLVFTPLALLPFLACPGRGVVGASQAAFWEAGPEFSLLPEERAAPMLVALN